MGLYSIRERMTLMGGRFESESSPGAGSRFVLIAPLEQEPRERQPSRTAAADAPIPVAGETFLLPTSHDGV